jgi:hypothetical protein
MKSMRKIARSEMKLREEANTSMWKMASVQINTFNQMMSNSIHATRGELDVTAAGVVETGTPLITTHNTAQGTPAQAMTMQVPGGNYANYASGVPMMPQGFYGAHAYNMMPPPPHGTYSGYGYAGQGGMMYQAHAHAQASSYGVYSPGPPDSNMHSQASMQFGPHDTVDRPERHRHRKHKLRNY